MERREVRTAEEFRRAVPEACGAASKRIMAAFAGDARARSFMGAGPLTVLDDNELDHWMRLLCVRMTADAEAVVWRLMAEAEVAARRGRGGRTLKAAELALADPRDVAPPQDEASVRGRVERAADALCLAAGADEALAAALINQVIAEERDTLIGASKLERQQGTFYATALVLAYFLDCVSKRPNADSGDLASCTAFASDMLIGMQPADGTWNSFYLDGGDRLSFTDRAVSAVKDVVGESHPLAKVIETLVVKATKAAAAPEEEWPDEADVRSARIAEAQQAAPVPERVWAMRNAAGASSRLPLSLRRSDAAFLRSHVGCHRCPATGCGVADPGHRFESRMAGVGNASRPTGRAVRFARRAWRTRSCRRRGWCAHLRHASFTSDAFPPSQPASCAFARPWHKLARPTGVHWKLQRSWRLQLQSTELPPQTSPSG